MKIRKIIGKIFTTILWSILTIITLFPIYWMVLVSTRTPVELFGKPNLSPTFFKKYIGKILLSLLLMEFILTIFLIQLL